ncbi:MAG: HAD family hydrolase, partial [Pararhodobacter sp.]
RSASMNIVFDVGNVLIRWYPERAVAHHFPDPSEGLAYLERVGFAEWNLANDGGRRMEEAVQALEAAHPGQSAPLGEYVAHFAETIREPIEGTWVLLDQLKAAGHRLFAITNFGAETWPVALMVHPGLATTFEDVVVSGDEKLLKPAPEIFRLLCDRNGLEPADCFFIDDSAKNVTGAQAVGMAAHHFTTPENLEADLRARGLL